MKFKQWYVGVLAVLWAASAQAGNDALEAVLEADHRKPENVERDEYRHPKETLAFFGVEPDMTVVEIWPGGGWYTEILAPYLREEGTFYAAQFPEDTSVDYFKKIRKKYMDKLSAHPEVYDKVNITAFNPPGQVDIAPAGSADRVLTFRNVHNWYMRGGGEERTLAAFKAFHKALKPGGVLGVVDHRLPEDRPLSDQEQSGYMRQDYVIDIAEKAGFELADKSEVNANPKDTADHPEGVWTLPPTLRLGEEKREHYEAIGESDRMTLKFVKPEADE
jgi:predicted methyltransferase